MTTKLNRKLLYWEYVKIEAAKVIADEDISGLSDTEIKEAREIASEIFKQGLLDELLHIQIHENENELD
ncbi:hypothetical protein LC613_27240 [Nostoc sphaeroides CHAB 2801]|uniref:hypothetical protein n=1 Tax=Nostoc sphaeroides TaxID=446679 RepID=UPI000E507A47|nr:hypothetical protein [Nostoc sphaeroides]MCC5631451.1 hypothetical protein [Nostoc sphaeroides CHAB 2801]